MENFDIDKEAKRLIDLFWQETELEPLPFLKAKECACKCCEEIINIMLSFSMLNLVLENSLWDVYELVIKQQEFIKQRIKDMDYENYKMEM